MELTFRGQKVEFGRVFNGSGAMGFFGDDHVRSPDPTQPEIGHPYWYSRVYQALGYGNDKAFGFTSKTATLRPRLSPELKRGNLLLQPDGIRVAERFPEVIRLFPGRGHGLNAVGLSNPGWQVLLETGRWQKRRRPFKISFMPEGETRDERGAEFEHAMHILARYLPEFQAPFILEVNPLCPNATQEQVDVIHETIVWGSMVRSLGIPFFVKLNLKVRPPLLDEYMQTTHVHGVIMGNALNWNAAAPLIDVKQVFGTATSPLAKYGGGAISGDPLFNPLRFYLSELKGRGLYTKPLLASGGIDSVEKVRILLDIGNVSGIEMATAFASHPGRIDDIVDAVNQHFENKET